MVWRTRSHTNDETPSKPIISSTIKQKLNDNLALNRFAVLIDIRQLLLTIANHRLVGIEFGFEFNDKLNTVGRHLSD